MQPSDVGRDRVLRTDDRAGGDGTILRGAEWVLASDTPLLGVNLGHVGFLAEAESSEIDSIVRARRELQLHRRGTLHHRRVRAGARRSGVWSSFAINEVSIDKAARERMLEIAVEVDDRPLSRWACDGVLLSTPTGSTAYAFSAGGPVIWPEVDALLIMPLSAHALFARPLVVGPNSRGRRRRWCRARRPTAWSGATVTARPSSTPGWRSRWSAAGTGCGWPGSRSRRSPTAWSTSSDCRWTAGGAAPNGSGCSNPTRSRSRFRGWSGPAVIEELRIADLGVIEEAALDLAPGLTVVTGETGAGKTMIVSGLQLLLGERADAKTVRARADRARVEGRFLLAIMPADGRSAAAGAATSVACWTTTSCWWPGQLTAAGRSRAFLGGAQVPAGRLRRRGQPLVTIHGQSDQIRLADRSRQREMLDRYAGSGPPGPARELRGAATPGPPGRRRRTEPAAGRGAGAGSGDRAAPVRAGRDRPASAPGRGRTSTWPPRPPGCNRPTTWPAPRAMPPRPSRAPTTKRAARCPGSPPLAAPWTGWSISTRAPRPLADRVAEAGYLVTELTGDLARYLDDLEAEPGRLEQIAERRYQLAGLTRRYGANCDEVLAWAEKSAARLGVLESADDRIAELGTPHRRAGRTGWTTMAGELRVRTADGRRADRGPGRSGARRTGPAARPAGVRADRRRAGSGRRGPGRAVVQRQPGQRPAAAGPGRLRRGAVPGPARAGGRPGRRPELGHLGVRRGRRRRRWTGRGRGRAPAGGARPAPAGDRGDPPRPGRRLRRPALRGGTSPTTARSPPAASGGSPTRTGPTELARMMAGLDTTEVGAGARRRAAGAGRRQPLNELAGRAGASGARTCGNGW